MTWIFGNSVSKFGKSSYRGTLLHSQLKYDPEISQSVNVRDCKTTNTALHLRRALVMYSKIYYDDNCPPVRFRRVRKWLVIAILPEDNASEAFSAIGVGKKFIFCLSF